MKLLYILLLLPIMNCFGQNKLKVETILTKYISTCKQTEKGVYVRYRQRVPIIDILEPQINIVHQKGTELKYQLQGNISSGGMSISQVKTIRLEKEIIEDQLILKHIVMVKHPPGKEGNNVMGYNYMKEEKFKIPNGIKVIKIELHEERLNQRTGSRIPKERLLSEKTISRS